MATRMSVPMLEDFKKRLPFFSLSNVLTQAATKKDFFSYNVEYNTTAVGSRSFLEKISRCMLSVRVHLNPILKQLYLPLNLGRVLSRESRAQLFRPAGACCN